MKAWSFAPFLCVLFSCSGAKSPRVDPGTSTDTNTDTGAGATAAADAGPATPWTVNEHGVIIDYETKKPVAGLTVSDNGLSTVTDAHGAWALAVPADALLQPIVSGLNYSQVLYPDSTSSGADVDFATAMMPDHSTFLFEQETLSGFDATKALVHVVVHATGACASTAGGSLTVLSPPGVTVTYFGASGIPQSALTSFVDTTGDEPVAVLYNVPPGSDLQVQVTHPTCTMVPFPATYRGKTYSGHVRTDAAEPGDTSTAMVLLLE